MNTVATYFNAEKLGGLIFVVVGLIAIGLAVWAWRHGDFGRGAAWPLVLVALLQVGVGGMVWWRSPQDLARVEQMLAAQKSRLVSEEVPRVQAVMHDFARNQRVELALVAIGLLLVIGLPVGAFWQGVGAGLIVQAGLVLLLDGFAERRAAEYLAALPAL